MLLKKSFAADLTVVACVRAWDSMLEFRESIMLGATPVTSIANMAMTASNSISVNPFYALVIRLVSVFIVCFSLSLLVSVALVPWMMTHLGSPDSRSFIFAFFTSSLCRWPMSSLTYL